MAMSAPQGISESAAVMSASLSGTPIRARAARVGISGSSESESAMQSVITPPAAEKRRVMPPQGNLPESSSLIGGLLPYSHSGEARRFSVSA